MEVPKLLEIADGRPFYRTENGQLQFLGLDGEYRDVVRPNGALCLEFHSKMNSLNPFVLSMIEKSIRLVPEGHKALVIYNEGSNFSVGANIGILLVAMKLRT